MGRLHSGYDVYLGAPDADLTEHSLTFTSVVIVEDMHAKVLRVKTKDDRGRWSVVYEMTSISKMQRPRTGSGIRWTGLNAEGATVQLTGTSTSGACIPCGRR